MRWVQSSAECVGILAAVLLAGCGSTPIADPVRREAHSMSGALPPAPVNRPAPPASEEFGALQNGIELAGVLRVAGERNPRIAAARARWKAAIEKYPQAVALPDPMVELGARYAQRQSGPKNWVYRFSQSLPFPSKLSVQGEVALHESEIARLQYEATIRDEFVEAKEACYELAYLAQAEETVAKVQELLERFAAFAAGELKVGATTLPESFRAQAQLAQLQYDRILVRELRETEQARLRSLLLLPPGTPLGPAAPPPFQPVTTDLPTLTARAEAHNQELQAAGRAVDKALAGLDLARQGRIPDFNFTVMAETPDTGKEPDEVEGTVGLNLPLQEGRNAARIREAQAMREAATADRVAEQSRVQAGTARLYFRMTNARRLVVLYRDSLLPQATQAMNAAEELFRAGKASFAAMTETAATWYNFQLAYHRAESDHAQAVGRLEQILGTTIEASPADAGGGR